MRDISSSGAGHAEPALPGDPAARPEYGWVDTLEAYCFTAAVGPDADETIRRLGGDPRGSTDERTFAECFWPAEGPQWAQVGPVHGGVLVAEHNGWRAEELVCPLSRGGRVACFFRNVQADMRFVYAIDGRIAAEFDPLLDHPPRTLAAAAGGLPFGLFGAEASALALLDRLTGVRVAPAWLDAPQRCVALPPLRMSA